MNFQNITNALIAGHKEIIHDISYQEYYPIDINVFLKSLGLYFFIINFIILII